MKLMIKQKVFSWRDRFNVYDQDMAVRYQVSGEIFTIGKKLHVEDGYGHEVAFIHEKVLTFLPKYYISQNGQDVAEVKKEFTFFKPVYSIPAFGWTVKGSIMEHNYSIFGPGGQIVAEIHKQWLAWGDTYIIDVMQGSDELMVLCTVLIIDAVMASQAAAASSASN